ncbi:MAG: kdgF [Clostridia bacterium]|jgi:quercetin dioxygenase-like cupin family protein|nr:kdgF [Clostridia bacterium]
MVIKENDAKVTVLNDLATRTLMVHNDKLMMVRFDFKKGGIGEPHSHDVHDQVGYILSGKFELMCNGETTIVTAGDSYVANPGVVHGVVALEDGAILDVFTPIRDEFIPN